METRQKILDVTEEMCAEMLPQKITLDMVAEKAGVGKGTIYTHFSGKDDLFEKLALTLIEKLRSQMMDAALSSRGNSLDKLAGLSRAFNGFMEKHPLLIAITIFLRDTPPWLASEEGDTGFFQLETVFFSMVESLVKLGIEEGLFRTDISSGALSLFIISVFRSRPPVLRRREELTDAAVRDLILNGAGIKKPI